MAGTRKKTALTCKFCGIQFYSKGGSLKQQYCSRKCAYASRVGVASGRKGKKYPHLRRARIGVCAVCGAEFRATGDFNTAKGVRKQIYCSKPCWAARGTTKIIDHVCAGCGKTFKGGLKRKYCSTDCANKYMVGENASCYKDGKSLSRERARHTNDLYKWREAVYERDSHTCQKCGATGEMHAHHIKSWATHINLRFDVDNGITLCVKCHGIEHGRDFSKHVVKQCTECGADIRNKTNSGLCRKCAIKKSWVLRKKKAVRL